MDEERIARIRSIAMPELRKWLENPNGAFSVPKSNVTFEAVEGGGILVRVRKWQMGDVS